MMVSAEGRRFEQGPIRPPSEAKSLLVRVTRNCPWNKCAFCRTYRGRTFSLRSLEEIKEDIRQMAAIAAQIQAFSMELGEGGGIGERTAAAIFRPEANPDEQVRSVAAWLYYGASSVFLQDGDSLLLKTEELAGILAFLKETFPTIRRITTYARAKSAKHKSVAELKLLREAGLSRIHIGMESGYDPLLAFIRKGTTAAELIAGGRKVKEAGLSLSEYVIPGLGGSRWSREHALETARVLNEINPNYIRLRTVQAVPGTALAALEAQGEFTPLDDEQILEEIRLFLTTLEGISSTVVSDHILNLLEEIEGTLPEAKPQLLGTIDRYFALSREERLTFRLGRRMGIFRRLDDLADSRARAHLAPTVQEWLGKDCKTLERELAVVKNHYI
ncbi:MAG: radical SAM protein [Syntrophaceae bacterium]|nr:radical SAM protein [Syntrophaceae bacterium]